MDNARKIKTLLTSAQMLMDDASAKVTAAELDAGASIKLLRDVSHDLRILADMIDVIDRVGRLPGMGAL